jgi:hypothetical protein
MLALSPRPLRTGGLRRSTSRGRIPSMNSSTFRQGGWMLAPVEPALGVNLDESSLLGLKLQLRPLHDVVRRSDASVALAA